MTFTYTHNVVRFRVSCKDPQHRDRKFLKCKDWGSNQSRCCLPACPTLPGAERHPPSADGHVHAGADERRLHMSRHVVRPLVRVAEEVAVPALGYDPVQSRLFKEPRHVE